jgi:hypothetical protein
MSISLIIIKVCLKIIERVPNMAGEWYIADSKHETEILF